MSEFVKIKVIVPEIITYYEVEVDDDVPSSEVAKMETQLFREGKLSWEDIIEGAPRDTVTFEGVEDE